jgi:lysozyme family protein
VHYREADLSWGLSIAQGDRWDRVSTHVPRGRGPFQSWRDAAIDALVKCAPFAARWTDWSMGGALTMFEEYNGTGYEEFHHENSPYNWGATNHEERGKYVADGKYDPAAWDKQIGAAALMKALFEIEQGTKA